MTAPTAPGSVNRLTRLRLESGYECWVAHSILIAVHALSGAVAFGCGLRALRRASWFAAYYWSMVAMAGFVVAAVAVGWPDLDSAPRIVFAGLLALAAVMLWRAEQARQLLRAGHYPSPAAVGQIGFTLVALADAFVVVGVIDLGAPAAVVLPAALLVALVGHLLVRRAQRGLAGAATPS